MVHELDWLLSSAHWHYDSDIKVMNIFVVVLGAHSDGRTGRNSKAKFSFHF